MGCYCGAVEGNLKRSGEWRMEMPEIMPWSGRVPVRARTQLTSGFRSHPCTNATTNLNHELTPLPAIPSSTQLLAHAMSLRHAHLFHRILFRTPASRTWSEWSQQKFCLGRQNRQAVQSHVYSELFFVCSIRILAPPMFRYLPKQCWSY